MCLKGSLKTEPDPVSDTWCCIDLLILVHWMMEKAKKLMSLETFQMFILFRYC